MQNYKKTNSKTNRVNKTSLSYSDIEDIVEYLVKVKASINTFDCWDYEDVSQEIRIICLNALEHFDSSRVKDERQLLNYFGRCVDYRLQNLKRDKYIRYAPPFNKKQIEQIERNPKQDEELYQKYLNFKISLQRKINIKHPVSIEVIGDSISTSINEQQVITNDIKEYLIVNIDDELRPTLVSLLNGETVDNIILKEKIQDKVRELLSVL